MTNNKNNMDKKITFLIGFFLTPLYYIHYIPVVTLSKKNYNNSYINHYTGINYSNNKKKSKIRSFDRSSKVNF